MTRRTIAKTLLSQIEDRFSEECLTEDFRQWSKGGMCVLDWYVDTAEGKVSGLIDAAEILGVPVSEMAELKAAGEWANGNIMAAHRTVINEMEVPVMSA